MKGSDWRLPPWLLALLCLLPFLGFWTYGLFDLDEGFYAAVVADMMRRGDWITPTLNGAPWFEKPILAYWLAIPSVSLFGEAVGPRLPSVLCTLATTWILYRFALRHWGLAHARVAALVYSTNILVVAIGRMMMTDAPLVLCLTIALTTLANWRLGESDKWGIRPWILIGLAVGLGILAKGPVALILFGGVLIVSTIWIPQFKAAWLSAWPLGLLVASLVAAAWYVPCYAINGRLFVEKFLIEQNIGRFAGGDKAHTVPAWAHPVFYAAILLLASLPWIVPALKRNREALDPQTRFALAWFLVPLVFFTISGTKLPHYILPAVPPLSLLIARSLLARRPAESWERMAAVWSPMLLVLAQFAFTMDWKNRMEEVQALARTASAYDSQLYVFRIGREGPASTGSLKLDQTSHPSIHFYYHNPKGLAAIETDDLEQIERSRPGSLVLTRAGRMPADLQTGLQAARLAPKQASTSQHYELWILNRQ